ncbi:MAG: hypothetical protein KIT11_05630 [Fimbriimonadaceae bacterium]|nr:hypothetical protein [Fimbriimonadaceae bacterium]QYK56626.1 MAG: hypothetical protein KF733_03885 [Fimbriimonadaceae bacterium]
MAEADERCKARTPKSLGGGGTVKDTVFLVFNRRDVNRMYKKRPPAGQLHTGEKVVELTVIADDTLWAPEPRFTAEVSVTPPNIAGSGSVAIDPEIVPEWQPDPAAATVAQIAGELLDRCLNTNDQSLKALALSALDRARAHGVRVQVTVPASLSEAAVDSREMDG